MLSRLVFDLLKNPPLFFVKSILQIKPSLFKYMIGIQRGGVGWLQFQGKEAGDHMPKGRAGGYNKLEGRFVLNR